MFRQRRVPSSDFSKSGSNSTLLQGVPFPCVKPIYPAMFSPLLLTTNRNRDRELLLGIFEVCGGRAQNHSGEISTRANTKGKELSSKKEGRVKAEME